MLIRNLFGQKRFKSYFFSAIKSFSDGRPTKYRLMFFGTDEIAQIVLQSLHLNQMKQLKEQIVEELEVTTPPDQRNTKRNISVKVYAKEKGLTVNQPISTDKPSHKKEWDTFIQNKLYEQGNKRFDIGIVCSFGYLVPAAVIEAFKKGVYVVHPSLLPAYRGASPIQFALLNGETKTGTSIIEISKGKFDAGDILYQEEMAIDPNARYTELAHSLATISGKALVDVLIDLDGNIARKKKQSDTGYKESKAPKLTLEDTVIDWSSQKLNQIIARYRAVWGSGFKTVRTKFNDKWFFLNEMSQISPESREGTLLKEFSNAAPGSIWILDHQKYKKNIYVKCIDGWVCVKSGYIDGSQNFPAYRFINDYLDRKQLHSDKTSTGHFFFK